MESSFDEKNNFNYIQMKSDMNDKLLDRQRFNSVVSGKKRNKDEINNEMKRVSTKEDLNIIQNNYIDENLSLKQIRNTIHIKKRDSKLKFGHKKLTLIDIEKISIQDDIYHDTEEFYSPRELKKEEIFSISSFSVECSDNTNQNVSIKVYKKSGIKKRESRDNLDILETDILLSSNTDTKFSAIKETYDEKEDDDEEDDDEEEHKKDLHSIHSRKKKENEYEEFFSKIFSSDVMSMYSVIILVIKSIIRYTFFNIPQCFALLGLFNGCMSVVFIAIMSIISVYYIMKIHEMKGYT